METNENVPIGKIVLGFFAVLVVLTVLAWIGDAVNLWHIKVFGVATENANREVYEQSKSYRDGQLQRLSNLCKEVSDNPERASMTNDIIAHEFANWQMKDTPDYLQSCLQKAR